MSVKLSVEYLEPRLAPATFTVTDNSDSAADTGSLRYALAHVAPGDTVDFATSVRDIVLTSNTTLTVGTDVHVANDLGTGPVTIDGNNATTLFRIQGGVTASLSGLTITHGSANVTSIYNSGALTLSNCTVSDNGTGIFDFFAQQLTVSDCTFSGNKASAIANTYGTATVRDSTFSDNTSTIGGAISNGGGALGGRAILTVSDCTFADNAANGAYGGGGIFNADMLTVSDSTFSGNEVGNHGSGVGGGNSGVGGGIRNYAGTAILKGNILVGNINTSTGANAPDDVYGDVNVNPSSSYNVIGTGGSGGLTDGVNNNQVGKTVAQVALAPLGNYGGPTQTFALLPGSVALGAGQPDPEPGVLANDQRGVARPTAGNSNAGSVQDHVLTLNVNTTANETGHTDTTLSLREALLLADGQLSVGSLSAGEKAQVVGTPGDITVINLTPATYTFATADNSWYGPNALPAISSVVVINGNGAVLQRDPALPQTTAGGLRFFYVSGGLSGLPAGSLMLNDLTLEGGYAKGGDSNHGGGGLGAGGAVFNQGMLNLNGVTLTGNTAQGGSSGVGSNNNSGGGGMGQDAQGFSGGGFGGAFPGGSGSAGGAGGAGGGGGGGGFAAPGGNANPTRAGAGAGGGNSGLGGDGGLGGSVGGDGGGGGGSGGPAGGLAGGAFGGGGAGSSDTGGGGGGGVGAGGGSGSVEGGGGGFGGGGASGFNGGGNGGFGGGGGSGVNAVGAGGFGGGNAVFNRNSGGAGAGLGGAVFSMYGSVTIVNSTFTANHASSFGSEIFNLDGNLRLTNATLAGDPIFTGNYGLYNLAYGKMPDGTAVSARVVIANSILASAGGDTDLVNNTDPFFASGTATVDATGINIIRRSFSIGAGTGISGTPQTADPMLVPLGNYGGPTQTMVPLPGSPAIAANPNGYTPGSNKNYYSDDIPGDVAIDQRGAPRVVHDAIDLGAVETQGFTLTPTNTPQSAAVNTAFPQPLVVTLTENFANAPLPGAAITYAAGSTGGASATLTSPALTDANGQTNVTATANGTAGGPYSQ